ncbi:MAG: polysaccharide biosynthesis tyrosine autokinase [Planctomycetota bacterium]
MSEMSLEPTASAPEYHLISQWSQRLLAVRKHWHLVALAVVLGLGAALIYLAYATHFYRAQASLVVQRQDTNDTTHASSADVTELYRTEYLRTQIELVRDPDTLEQAYTNLRDILAAKGKTDTEIEDILPEDSWFKNLEVESVPDSLIFHVTYDDPSKDMAKLVVQQVVQAYAVKEQANRKDVIQKSTEMQTAARDAAKKDMDDATAALQAYQIKYQLFGDADISNSIVRKQYDDIASRRNDMVAQMTQLRQLHDDCQALLHSSLPEDQLLKAYSVLDFGAAAANVRAIEMSLMTEQTTLQQLEANNGPRHWDVQIEESKIAALNQMRLDEYRRLGSQAVTTYDAMQTIVTGYKSQLGDLQKQNMDYQTAITEFTIMQADLNSKTEYYSKMKDQLAELQNQLNSEAQTIVQQNAIYIYPNAVRPRPMVVLLAALCASLLLGVMLAMTVEFLDDSIKHPEELTPRTGFPFLGLVPHVPNRFTPSEKVTYISKFPQTSFSESIRSLRVNIIITLGARDISNGVLAVTSSVPKEGKSLVTSNLAASFVQSGKRTLLLQADLRRPTPAQQYGLDPEAIATRGTSAALMGITPYADCVHQLQDNLYLMPCGTCPNNPSELIGAKMKELVAWTRTQFDMVIIDTPPLINVSDTLLISPICDGVLMVIHGGSTSSRLVRRAQEMLARTNALVVGAVLNDVTSAVERHHKFAERYGMGMYSYYSKYYNKYGYSSNTEPDLKPASSGSTKAMD